MDPWDIARFVGIPVASVVGGWIGAASRIVTKIKSLETEVLALKAALKIDSDALRAGLRLEVEGHKGEVARLISDVRRDFDRLERDLTKVRDSSTDYAKDAELAQFMLEVNTRWERIQHTLGVIEGEMRAQSRMR